jgi:hypothetical protein
MESPRATSLQSQLALIGARMYRLRSPLLGCKAATVPMVWMMPVNIIWAA